MSTSAAGVASGVLAALALPPFHLWPLAFVALVPIAFALSGRGVSRLDAVHAGLGFGAAFYGLLLHWMPFTVAGLVPAGWIVGLLAVVLLVGVSGVQGAVLRRLLAGRPPRSYAPILVLPAVWGTTELLLASAGPLAMPWTPLGLALASAPDLAGVAEWVGVRGLGLWIAGVNGALLVALRQPRPWRAARTVGVALLLVLLPASAAVIRAQTLPTTPLPPIMVARMSIPRDVLLQPELRDREVREALIRIARSERAARAARSDSVAVRPAFAVLPEAPFAAALSPEVESAFRDLARDLALPVLAGTHVQRDGGLANAVVLVEPSGVTRVVHGKRRLVPGVERPGLTAGEPAAVVRLTGAAGAVRLALAVCFEAAFGGDVRALRLAGAELLVNPTNDAWFRPVLSASRSAAHFQHRAHLVMRAVEMRMGAVRAPLGGELLVVSPTGRITAVRPPGGEGLVHARPAGTSVLTLYARTGDLAGPFATAILIGLLVGAARRRR